MSDDALVILQNLTRTPCTLLLDVHTVNLSGFKRIELTVGTYDRDAEGERARTDRRRFPTALTLWAHGTLGSESAPIHRDVLKASDVAAAIKAGRVRVVTPPAKAPEAQAPTAPPPVAPPDAQAAQGGQDATATPNGTVASTELTTEAAAPRKSRGKES